MATNIAHTPGPWLSQGICYEGEERGSCFIVAENLGGLVGAALPWPTELVEGDFPRVEANARLIAAAPDLLEALVAAKQEMWLAARSAWTMADFKNWASVQQIDAALEKADGKPRTAKSIAKAVQS